MKIFTLVGTIIFGVLNLILAFENLGAACSVLYLFLPLESPFLIVAVLSFTGFLTGVFFTMLLFQLLTKRPEDEEAPGGEWQ